MTIGLGRFNDVGALGTGAGGYMKTLLSNILATLYLSAFVALWVTPVLAMILLISALTA